MKKLSLFVFVLLFAGVANAQIKFGPKVGLNLSEMSATSNGISLDPQSVTGLQVGLIAEIPTGKNFYFQPGILYSKKGTEYDVSFIDMTIKPDYIEIPLNTVYKLKLKGSAKLLLSAGPYFAIGIGGDYSVNGETHNINWGTSDNDDLKPFDTGMNFGVGFEIHNLQLMAQYIVGFLNLNADSSTDVDMKMGGFSFTIAYLFSKK